jgi:hypothetical protein
MRPRWPEWVIVVSLVVIGLTGIVAIWGGDMQRLVLDVSRGDQPPAPATPAEPEPPVSLPGGVPAGPF